MRWLLLLFARGGALSAPPAGSLRELVASQRGAGVRATASFAPPGALADGFRFRGDAGAAVDGAAAFEKALDLWEAEAKRDLPSDLRGATVSVSSLARNEVTVRWNATWTPPPAAWLNAVAGLWPGVEAAPTPYADKARDVIAFSWKKVFRLFGDAARTGRLRVPLACVEGTSRLTFEDDRLRSVTEDYVYADLLRRGQLRNRRCAEDLRTFLEVCRRPPTMSEEAWASDVGAALPWRGVPGSNPLDVEPGEGGAGEVVVFAVLVVGGLAALSATLAPVLLGAGEPPPGYSY